jgi:hypothetical protein
MKRIMTLSAILMLGLVFFAGCSKKSDSPSYSMKATIGGTAFSVTNCYAVLNNGVLSITGSSGTSTSGTTPPFFTVVINTYTTATTYTLDTTALVPNIGGTYSPTLNIADMKGAKSGSVTISSASSSSYTGTFNFILTDGTAVTGGTFTAKKLN